MERGKRWRSSLILMTGIVLASIFALQGTASPGGGGSSGSNDQGRIVMVFGGDVMLARGVETSVSTLGMGDYTFPWLNIADSFRQGDIAFVNLESPITDKGAVNTGKSFPWFRADPGAMAGLQFAGIDIVSVANNHAFDYGRAGFEDCLARLHGAGIRYAGGGLTYKEAYSPVYIMAKGKKIAFLVYTYVDYYPCYSWRAQEATDTTPECSGIAWLSESALKQGISQARRDKANLIVVSMHFGVEYTTAPSSAQQKFAQYAISQGASLVIGHHPHVTQPTVAYAKGCIAYSLGNLIFDQFESNHAGVTHGKVLAVTVESGRVAGVEERPILINEATWQPGFE